MNFIFHHNYSLACFVLFYMFHKRYALSVQYSAAYSPFVYSAINIMTDRTHRYLNKSINLPEVLIYFIHLKFGKNNFNIFNKLIKYITIFIQKKDFQYF